MGMLKFITSGELGANLLCKMTRWLMYSWIPETYRNMWNFANVWRTVLEEISPCTYITSCSTFSITISASPHLQFHYQFFRFFLTYKPVFLLRQITSLSHYSAVAFVAHQLVLRCVPSKWSWSLQWYGLHCSELVQSCDKFWSSISH